MPTERAWRFDLEEEVGAPDPFTVKEGRLIDDVPSLAHRFQRVRCRAGEFLRGARGSRCIAGELLDGATGLHEPVEGVVLVPRTSLAQQGGHLRLAPRQVLAERRPQAELRQVIACEE